MDAELLKQINPALLRTHVPAVVEAIEKEAVDKALIVAAEEKAAVIKERDDLQLKVTEHEATEAVRKLQGDLAKSLDEKIAEAKIPVEVVTEERRARVLQLAEHTDESARPDLFKAVIAEWQEIAKLPKTNAQESETAGAAEGAANSNTTRGSSGESTTEGKLDVKSDDAVIAAFK